MSIMTTGSSKKGSVAVPSSREDTQHLTLMKLSQQSMATFVVQRAAQMVQGNHKDEGERLKRIWDCVSSGEEYEDERKAAKKAYKDHLRKPLPRAPSAELAPEPPAQDDSVHVASSVYA